MKRAVICLACIYIVLTGCSQAGEMPTAPSDSISLPPQSEISESSGESSSPQPPAEALPSQESSQAFSDPGESSAPPASPSQSASQSDPNNFAPVDALCDYLLENLSPSQYTSISRQRDRDNNSNLVAQVWTPDRAPVEALVAAYPGEPVPVKYVDTRFSKAEQDAALEAVNAFFEEHPEIPLICVNRWYDQVMIYLEAPSEDLEAFIAESSLKEIYLVEVYPGGILPENPD